MLNQDQLHLLLRLGIFCLEIALTFGLLLWLRTQAPEETLKDAEEDIRQEPLRNYAILLGLGGLTAIICAIVEQRYFIDTSVKWHHAANLSISALIEELAKYAVGAWLLLKLKPNQTPRQILMTMVLLGLGFSLTEDFVYLLSPDTIAPYRLLSFYVHSGTAAIIGAGMVSYLYQGAKYRRVIWGVLGAIFLHLIYNLSALLQPAYLVFMSAVALTGYITAEMVFLYREAPDKIPTKIERKAITPD